MPYTLTVRNDTGKTAVLIIKNGKSKKHKIKSAKSFTFGVSEVKEVTKRDCRLSWFSFYIHIHTFD